MNNKKPFRFCCNGLMIILIIFVVLICFWNRYRCDRGKKRNGFPITIEITFTINNYEWWAADAAVVCARAWCTRGLMRFDFCAKINHTIILRVRRRCARRSFFFAAEGTKLIENCTNCNYADANYFESCSDSDFTNYAPIHIIIFDRRAKTGKWNI